VKLQTIARGNKGDSLPTDISKIHPGYTFVANDKLYTAQCSIDSEDAMDSCIKFRQGNAKWVSDCK
jgi:hypothetical protein